MPFNSSNIDALARMAAVGLLNSLVVGIVMAGLALALVRLAGRQGSAIRFKVWFLALIAIALLPWVGSLAASSATAPTHASGILKLPDSLAYYLVSGWIIGTALGIARVAHGLYRLRRLRASCTPVGAEELDPIVQETLAGIPWRRSVTLCVSNAVRVPAAIGYFRPFVVFPAWALAEIPPQELSAILLHELAHLRRYDDWTNLAQKLVRALFFFHPAVWFIDSRLTLEREMSCDDAVLATDFTPRAYAESLIGLAEKSFLRRGIQLAQAAVGHVQQLKLRLSEILRRDRIGQGNSGFGKLALALMALALFVGGYGLARTPGWIAFSGGPAVHAALVARQLPQGDVPASEVSLRPVNLVLSTNSAAQGNFALAAVQSRVRRVRHVARVRVPAVVQRTSVDGFVDQEPSPPKLVLSGLSQDLTEKSVLVVFQTKEFGRNGPVFWQITVFRIIPALHTAAYTDVPKKI